MVSETRDVVLSAPELEALARLVHLIVELDDDTSPAESDEITLIASQVDEEKFWAAFESVRAASPADLDSVAGAISRRPAQELVYSLLEEVADADGEDSEQRVVLERLRHSWSLED